MRQQAGVGGQNDASFLPAWPRVFIRRYRGVRVSVVAKLVLGEFRCLDNQLAIPRASDFEWGLLGQFLDTIVRYDLEPAKTQRP